MPSSHTTCSESLRLTRRSWLKAGSGAVVAACLATSFGATVRAAEQGATSGKRRIKVGQMGVGHAHASKLSVFRESPDFEVVGVVEPDEALRGAAVNQAPYRDLPWLTREQLLNRSDVELVLVETRVRDLLDNAEACVAAGKHLHLDKPAGASLPRYRRLLESAERQKLQAQMGYMYRYNPGVQLLHRCLREGWLGEIFEAHAVMSKVVGVEDRKKLAEYPGGIMFELGCHVIDLVVGVLGAPQSVQAVAQQVARGGDNLLDNMLAVFSYPSAIATVKSSAVEVEGFARRHLVVCGTEGTLHIQPLDSPTAKLALSKPRGEFRAGYQDVPLPKYTRYVDDAAELAAVIRGERPSRFSYSHDLAVQACVLQASRLDEEGRPADS